MSNDISFKSRIKFVDKNSFIKIANGKKIDQIEKPCAFAEEFYTTCIRTCTGGGIVSPKNECYGFHILDNERTNKIYPLRLKLELPLFGITPERALLIGSKDHQSRPFSKENFKEILNVIKKFTPNITRFEEHTDRFAQSSLHYDLKTDTYTILTQFVKNEKEDYIKTLQDLLENFRKIKITNGDELYIGETQITKQACPEIFE